MSESSLSDSIHTLHPPITPDPQHIRLTQKENGSYRARSSLFVLNLRSDQSQATDKGEKSHSACISRDKVEMLFQPN